MFIDSTTDNINYLKEHKFQFINCTCIIYIFANNGIFHIRIKINHALWLIIINYDNYFLSHGLHRNPKINLRQIVAMSCN